MLARSAPSAGKRPARGFIQVSTPVGRTAALVLLVLAWAGPLRAAIITVNTADDLYPADDGTCSLREAVTAANDDAPSGLTPGECSAGSGADEIQFALPSLPAIIGLNIGHLVVTEDLTITGPGSTDLRIEAQGLSRHFVLWEEDPLHPRTYTLRGLTLTGGWGVAEYEGWGLEDAGAIAVHFADLSLDDVVFEDNLSNDAGGAIYFNGVGSSLTIERCTFRRNKVVNQYLIGAGGAIAVNGGNAVIRESTFEANEAQPDDPDFAFSDGNGGAVYIWSTASLTVERSTFVGNIARGSGGAIAISLLGAGGSYDIPTTITSSTFTANEADTDGDGTDSGGALKVWDSISDTTLVNSIVAGNLDHSTTDTAPDLAADAAAASITILSGGHNLIGIRKGSAAASFPAGQPNASDDWVGTNPSPLDAGLLPLGDNGGPTPTIALDIGTSPAIDRGSCPGEPHDQRGYVDATSGTRSVDDPAVTDADDGCDIGAYEAHGDPPSTLQVDGFESGRFSAWDAHTS
jgi:CSLREA domain-containing protein